MSTPRLRVRYLIQRKADLDPDLNWLGPLEAEYLSGLRFLKRRTDWLLSRWTAKSALLRYIPEQGASLRDWQIAALASGAPTLLLKGQPAETPISLSHSQDTGLCVATAGNARLGCDLETVETRSRLFEETFFTESEVDLLSSCPDQERDRFVTLFWSAKEAALKVLQLGLRADTRRVRVRQFDGSSDAEWRRLALQDSQDGALFQGWWRPYENMVMTVLCDHPIEPPIPL